MSMAEAIAVVAETDQAIPVVMPAMPQARPRISADTFRNLTARLKTSGNSNVPAAAAAVTVPTISVVPVQPQATVAPAPAPVKTEPVTTLDVQPVDEMVENPLEQAPLEAAPAIDIPVIETPVIHAPEIAVPEIAAPTLEVFEQAQQEAAAWDIQDAALHSAEAFEPSHDQTEELAAALAPGFEPDLTPVPAPVLVSSPQPNPEPQPRTAGSLIERAIAFEKPTPAPQKAFPELVNPLEVMAAQEAARRAEEERLKAEAEAKAALAPPPPPRDPEEEARKLAELAEARTIENIWRQILATPTKDDCAAYLAEAREIMGEDDMHLPDEEHDLSRIAPADELTQVEEVPEVDTAPDVEMPKAVDEPADPAVAVPVILESGHQDTAEFARSLLDMMAAGASSGLPHERTLAADTLLRLVPRLDLKPLVMLSQRLAIMENPPHLLVAKLIRDPRVEVSGPLLEDCMQMTDSDLLMVIDENKADKLRMIARRRRLSRAISDALIKTEDPSVLLTLVRNMEAEISHEGFNTLIESTDRYPDLLAPLSTRPDLGAPFAFELFWHAPAQLRRYLLTRFLTDSETLSKILKITMATKEEDDSSEIEPMSQHVILEALDRAARGKLEPACDELSSALQIDPKTVMRILSDMQGEPLIILLKAANYSRSAIPGLLRRMIEADFPIIASTRDPEELQSMFDTLSFNKARILLTYWDWATTKTGPYAPVH